MASLHGLGKKFGSLDFQVSPLSLGTVKFGRNKKTKNANGDGIPLPSLQHCQHLLETAAELGINTVDTAPAYGLAEERLGRIISNRHDWVITTKVGEIFDNDTGDSKYTFDKLAVENSIQQSLLRLNTDFIDFVYVHCSRKDHDELRSTDVLPTLEAFKKKGIIRGFGASISSQEAAEYALQYTDGIMVTYNLNETQHHQIIQKARALKKAVVIKKGFLQGFLKESTPEKALQHVLKTSAHSLVCGTTNIQHLKENVSLTARILKEAS